MGLLKALLERLSEALADLGVQLKSGQIVDVTFVPVPIQRNSQEENPLLKSGAVPLDWSPHAEQPQ